MARTKLYRADLARLAGIQIDSLQRLNLPKRDGTDIDRGKARPYWYASTVNRWLAQRPGKGWRKGIRNEESA